MTCGESDLKRDALPKGLCPSCGGKIAFGHAHMARSYASYAYFCYCAQCDSLSCWDRDGVGGGNERQVQDAVRGFLKYVEARRSARSA